MTSSDYQHDADRYAERRARMVACIEAEARQTAVETGLEQFSPAVIAAMSAVPRHRFVPDYLVDEAYVNLPLPIGCGQTISQPYIVALMTELLELRPDSGVLEIGCGSGYQAAVLAQLAAKVYSVELEAELAEQARERLQELGYDNVKVICGDGYHGWPEFAPYDAIIITAAISEIPPPLLEQLKPEGRLVVPLDSAWGGQDLLKVTKRPNGTLEPQSILPVAFVPFRRRGSRGQSWPIPND